MSNINEDLTPEKCCEDAKQMLELKDALGFMSKITSAIILSGQDQEMLAQTTYLQAEGLLKLKQYKKALESINEAMRFNAGEWLARLKNYKGVIYGYLGDANKAERFCKEALVEVSEPILSAEICLSLSWIYMTVRQTDKKLEEAKRYLDQAKEGFEFLSNDLKLKICNSYGIYYYYRSEFERAIEEIDEALTYAVEKDKAALYNDKAEILLKYDEEFGGVSIEIKNCLEKAEVIATKYNDLINLGFTFYIGAMAEVQDGQFFTALDTLNLSFEHFTEAELYTYSLECLLKINELVSTYTADCMKAMQEKFVQKVDRGLLSK